MSMCVDVAFMASLRQDALIAATLILMGAALPAVSAEEAIDVILDQARIAKVPERTTTMVVGNPLIADVSIQAGGTMVVTGKGFGVTNLIASAGSRLAIPRNTLTAHSTRLEIAILGRSKDRRSGRPRDRAKSD
jgi:Flp pilus assembly secretin CpaC